MWITASLLLLIPSQCLPFADAQEAASLSDSDRVRFILSVRCVGCHNASEKNGGLDFSTRQSLISGGDSGPAFHETSPAESPFWKRIEAGEMPPKKSLAADEAQAVQKWLQSGAIWPGEALDPAEFSSDSRAGYDWWSLQPLRKVVPPISSEPTIQGEPTIRGEPTISSDRQQQHPIDAFVVAKLQEAGMTMSRPSDRKVLARRLAFDVTGLPPTQTFVQACMEASREANSVKQIEECVNQLLDSPLFGQRWARHWLDAVRFGESHGFERDQLRSNAWRYRDWVVHAINADMPYDEFCRMQIAGDALLPSSAEGTIATGMLVCGPYDQVGQTQQSQAMRSVVRQDELEDLVGTISQTFLGLTVNCSRCHDHKFDPIPQREYYQMCAALAGSHHGETRVNADFVVATARTVEERQQSRQQQLQRDIEAIETPVRERLESERRLAVRREIADSPVGLPQPIARWEFEDLRDSIGNLDLELKSTAAIRNGRLHLNGVGFAKSKSLKRQIKEKTLEVWVQLENVNQRGGAAIGIEKDNGAVFDAIVFGEIMPGGWFAGSEHFSRTESFQSTEMETVVDSLIHIAMVYDSDGTIRAYRNGRPYGEPYRKVDLIEFPPETSHILFGLRHSPVDESRVLKGSLEKAQLYDYALTDSQVLASAVDQRSSVSHKEVLAQVDPGSKPALEAMHFELKQVLEHRARSLDPKVYTIASKEPNKTFVLARGNPNSPTDEVVPGGISSIRGLDSQFSLKGNASDGERRTELASWITDRRNPLFARAIVNRVWQHHFGVGMVDTPNDFGFNGGRPSHPELLDWLANDLIEHGWSLKHLHRRILTSQTYQQSSRPIDAFLARDSGNRLLWRKQPWRLDAESLRDTMLSLAGILDPSLDGPGFYEFDLSVNNSHFYFMRDPIGETFQRRTLYRTVVRSGRSNFLDVFDCPDPSTKTPQRASTTTPLQSLSLMNNSFAVRMSKLWADRVELACPDSTEGQVSLLFEQAFSRTPSPMERNACVDVAKAHGLSTVCRALINSNELLYVD